MSSTARPSLEELQVLLESQTIVEAQFESRNNGGYGARLLGYNAFLPGSHSLIPATIPLHEDPLVNTTAPVVIIEVRASPFKLVISRRAAKAQLIAQAAAAEKAERQAHHLEKQVARDAQRRAEFVQLSVGSVVEATASHNIPNAAGGLAILRAGLIQISITQAELGYGDPPLPERGTTFTCLITALDPVKHQARGSIKRLLPDPWLVAADHYPVGSQHLVKVKTIVKAGLFAEIAPGLNCHINRNDIPGTTPTTDLAHHFTLGDQFLITLLAVDAVKRRIGAVPVAPTLPNSEDDRRRQVSELFEKNSAGSPEVLRNLAGAMRGVQGDMYWAVDRFVFELLQNADDLPARPGGSVRVQVRLLPNFLVFQHNGLPFRHEHVVALANVNQSTKTRDAATTGYKGIGFKSVYSESSCVYVRSGGYSFRFASEGNEGVPWQTWPRWTEPADYPDELRNDPDFFNDALFPVSFGLQIQPGKQATYADELRKLFRDPRFALFLRSLDNIRLVGEKLEEIELTRTRHPTTAQIVFDALGQQSAYLRHEYPVRIDDKFKPGQNPNPDDAPAAKLPDKLKGVDSVTVQFAAALDPATDDLLALNPAEAALSAYLPTEDTTYNLPLLVNADFTLTSSRERVTLNNPWNEFLFHQIGRLLIKWLADRLREQPDRARYLYGFIPPAQDANKNQLALTAGIMEGVQTIPFLLKAGSGEHTALVLPQEAVLDEAGCYHLLPDLYHAYLTDKLAVIDPVAASELHRTGLSERLPLFYINLSEFQAAFDQENVTDYYTPGDAARLLVHLAADPTTQAAQWRSVRWLFNEQDELVAPKESALYGALSEAWDYDFPLADQAHHLHPQLQAVLRTNPEVAAWVETKLRIATYSRQAVVRDLLLPAASDNTTDAAISDQYIQYLFRLHQQQKLQGWLTETDRKRLAVMNVLCDDGNYYKVANAYLSCHYAPLFELEALAGDLGKAQFPLVAETYIAPAFDEPTDWREFWRFCGIRTPDAAELLNTKLLLPNAPTTTWSATKHEAVLRLALTAFTQGQAQKLPLTELPKLQARTTAGTAPLADCILPPAHNPALALLTQLPLNPVPKQTINADYFHAADPAAVGKFFHFAGCKPWDEAKTLAYACEQLLVTPLDLPASVAVVRQLYQWYQGKKLTTSHIKSLHNLPLYQKDGSASPGGKTFFGSFFKPTHDIELLSEGQQQQVLAPDYLPTPVSAEDLVTWKAFFSELGVADKFSVLFHEDISYTAAQEQYPAYIKWVDDNPAICPLPHRSWRSQHGIRYLYLINNPDLVTHQRIAELIAQLFTKAEDNIKSKAPSVYYSTFTPTTWPAGSLLCAYPLVPCTGSPALRPAHEVYSKHLAAMPTGAPVATVTYGSLALEERLGLRTRLTPDAALELLAQASVSCQAGQPVTDQARSLFAKTLTQVQPWLTEKARISPTWRTRLLLPAANNTWLSADKAHLVSRNSLYLKTSGAILHDLSRALSSDNYQAFAAALGIPLLTEKQFKLTQFAEADIKPQTPQVLQRLESYRLFPLLCDYRSLPAAQATKWMEEAKSLFFAQVPALKRECTVIPGYCLESEYQQYVAGKQYFFVGHLWSACQWQALADFLVQQLDLPVSAHVVIRLLESNDPAAQAAVFEQAGYPVPASLQAPAPPPAGAAAATPPTATPQDSSKTSLLAEQIKSSVPVKDIDMGKVKVTIKPPSPVVQQTKPPSNEIADNADRSAIGRRCEELVHRWLTEEKQNYQLIAWPNQTQEAFEPYDFIVTRNGTDRVYLEVKGTPSRQKDIIYLSPAEWRWMLDHKEDYSIIRVYGALSDTPTIEETVAPGPKIFSGELIPHAIELKV